MDTSGNLISKNTTDFLHLCVVHNFYESIQKRLCLSWSEKKSEGIFYRKQVTGGALITMDSFSFPRLVFGATLH